MNILVTGSAGYIGSHACLKLLEEGHQVLGIDNYCRGNRGATAVLERFDAFKFIQADIRDRAKLLRILTDYEIKSVMHFAAYAYIAESCHTPLFYYNNNICGSLALLEAIGQAGITKLVFSSTCATYGEPSNDQIPIREDCDQKPINPYGRSKLMVEQAIKDFAGSDESPEGFSFAILRYFNVAGADPLGRIGEVHMPETHIIPLCLQAASGQKERIDIYGTDYPTKDGTCIRGYVHVADLIDAHIKSISVLKPGYQRSYNIGTGIGYSVKEVIETCKYITNIDFTTNECDRRPGDPPVLYADSSTVQKEIGWSPLRGQLEMMIADSWRWMKVHPEGFDES